MQQTILWVYLMSTQSRTLAWRIPRTKEPGRLPWWLSGKEKSACSAGGDLGCEDALE